MFLKKYEFRPKKHDSDTRHTDRGFLYKEHH